MIHLLKIKVQIYEGDGSHLLSLLLSHLSPDVVELHENTIGRRCCTFRD